MTHHLLTMLIIALLLVGCTRDVHKVPVPVGGSRAGGFVELSYGVGLFERPVVDWAAAERSANDRCRAWGYSAAGAFGGQKTHCHLFNEYGNCVLSTVTIDYQCID